METLVALRPEAERALLATERGRTLTASTYWLFAGAVVGEIAAIAWSDTDESAAA